MGGFVRGLGAVVSSGVYPHPGPLAGPFTRSTGRFRPRVTGPWQAPLALHGPWAGPWLEAGGSMVGQWVHTLGGWVDLIYDKNTKGTYLPKIKKPTIDSVTFYFWCSVIQPLHQHDLEAWQ